MKKTILISACLMMLLSLAVLAASMHKDEKATSQEKGITTQEVKSQQDARSDKETKTIADTLKDLPEASLFLFWMDTTETDKELEGQGPMTVLVPINLAFDAMPADLRKEIQEDKDKKKSCCRYHILKGDLSLEELKATGKVVETLCDEEGCTMEIGALLAEYPDLIEKEIECNNGRIYLINTVMVPEECKKGLLEKATDEAKNVYKKTRDAVGEGIEKTTDAMKSVLPYGSESK